MHHLVARHVRCLVLALLSLFVLFPWGAIEAIDQVISILPGGFALQPDRTILLPYVCLQPSVSTFPPSGIEYESPTRHMQLFFLNEQGEKQPSGLAAEEVKRFCHLTATEASNIRLEISDALYANHSRLRGKTLLVQFTDIEPILSLEDRNRSEEQVKFAENIKQILPLSEKEFYQRLLKRWEKAKSVTAKYKMHFGDELVLGALHTFIQDATWHRFSVLDPTKTQHAIVNRLEPLLRFESARAMYASLLFDETVQPRGTSLIHRHSGRLPVRLRAALGTFFLIDQDQDGYSFRLKEQQEPTEIRDTIARLSKRRDRFTVTRKNTTNNKDVFEIYQEIDIENEQRRFVYYINDFISYYTDESQIFLDNVKKDTEYETRLQKMFNITNKDIPDKKILFHIADGRIFDSDLIETVGKLKGFDLFLTRNKPRARQKLQDRAFFSREKRHLNLVEGSASVVVSEYKKACEFFNGEAQATSFCMVVAHAEPQLEARLDTLVAKDTFKERHVLLRVCCTNATYLPTLSRKLLDDSPEHAALSVTYAASQTASIPASVLEMFYMVTHPSLLQDPAISPREALRSVERALQKLVTQMNDDVSFSQALSTWWAEYTSPQSPLGAQGVPEEIRNLIRRFVGDREEIKQDLDQRNLDPVQEVHIPPARAAQLG